MNIRPSADGTGTPVRAEPGVCWLAPAAMAGILAHARAAERVSPHPAFWVLSDLRVDLRPDLALPEPLPAFDAMLVAGNVGPGLSASLTWLARALDGRQGRRPVCVVPGNVEYRSGTPMAEALARGRELAADLGLVLLSDDAFRFGPAHGDGTVVVGATLWTDWQLGASSGRPPARVAARTAWEEAGRIELRRGRPLTPLDTLAMHARSRAFIEDALTSAAIGSLGLPPGPNACVDTALPGDAAVVVTCHAPTPRSLPVDWEGWHADPWLPASLASEAAAAMAAWGAPSLWVHGNVPAAADHRVAKTRVVANPRTGGRDHAMAAHAFDPTLVVTA